MRGSTAGGIKITRLVWLVKNAAKHPLNRMNDRAEPETYRFNDRTVETEKAVQRVRYAPLLAGIFWSVGLLCDLAGAADNAHPPAMHLLFEAASDLGSVGLSSGVTRPEMPAGPITAAFTRPSPEKHPSVPQP